MCNFFKSSLFWQAVSEFPLICTLPSLLCHMETMETVTDFNMLGSKITADGDCNHEIKRCLLLGRKLWQT